MIVIAGSVTDINSITEQYPQTGVKRKILEILSSSSEAYYYDSHKQLEFELSLRKKNIDTSYQLHKSGLLFRTFRESICNPYYWTRTDEGGFLLNRGVRPSAAVRDIFVNSSQYGTECATAIVIVYYGALADIYAEELFNNLFSDIYLMDWMYLDSDLGVNLYRDVPDYLPGDCRYFKNPDVNPLTPQWQGENAVDLGNGMYYGHGIGIRSAEQIISALNKHRVKGSSISAYLTNTANRPDYKYLANRYYNRVYYSQSI